ncbi:xylose ABC transporter ATP-binding protein [Faecalicatena orotica]|uniref:D-xylose transport system ATP-binding protein n=1 Tax=Faecalicatena orotica TaxID=1544 RepID=A0A2Y9BMI2_9FIRM|nr:sugar ABC transporter ATP-binding protein [Faecalicatena orotica]PWJ22557.1 D-xylose transport system ATP-binding protein [Faecalicatena orotica]SSA58226.1 D-xylose transport system ATP-binding protein [Faecalicatena orotica]
MGLAVEMKQITKAFSGVKAIDDVSLKVEEGEIHALIGENGAGKSTLMNVLSGSFSHHTYEGSVWVKGKQVKLTSPDDANKAGIVMVHQELALIPEISVAENVFLGHLPKNRTGIDWKTIYGKAEEALERLSLSIDVKSKVKYLSVGQQQLVEIAKAIMMGGRVLILDEPTAPLTDRETEILFRILKDLKEDGITIIYISHRLEEIFKLTDTVSVMRDGKMIVTKKTSELTTDSLVSYMIGRELKNMYPDMETKAGEVILEIQDYCVRHPEYEGKNIVSHVNMKFCRGEIVGISGLLGAGRTELMMAVTGGYRITGKGKILLDGREVHFKSPKEAIRAGIGFVTEDRKGNGLIVDQSLCFNCSLAALDKVRARHMLNRRMETTLTEKFINELKIKTVGMYHPVKSLSGGNQQKAVLAKWLATNPRILILDEPTRGVDVGAKYEIYTIMKELAEAGVAIIMISSDLPEVIGMSDRVYIMSEGSLTGELHKGMLTEENIMKYATNTANC